jgi:hypothetical protein
MSVGGGLRMLSAVLSGLIVDTSVDLLSFTNLISFHGASLSLEVKLTCFAGLQV